MALRTSRRPSSATGSGIGRANGGPDSPQAQKPVVASAVLQQLHDSAPKDYITVNWMLERIPNQSFGLVLLMLGIGAAAPGIGVVAQVLIVISALQMIIGRSTPLFPRWIADRKLPRKHLSSVVSYAIKVLKFLERAIRPRFPTQSDATKRVVGIVVLSLTILVLLNPIPLSNILPAVIIAFIALAYLEQDGLLLAIAVLAGLTIIAVNLELISDVIRTEQARRG